MVKKRDAMKSRNVCLGIIFVLFAMILAGCSNGRSLFSPKATITPTASLTPTITPTHTPSPTNTSLPTSTPTATATISFPVRNETPIPDLDFPVISIDNADRLVEVARYGYPNKYGWQMLKPVNEIMVTFSDKVQFVSMLSKKVLAEISLVVSPHENYDDPILSSASMDGKFVTGITIQSQVEVWNRENEQVYTYSIDPNRGVGHGIGLSIDGNLLAVSSCESELDIWQGGYSCKTEIINWFENKSIKTIRGLYPTFTPNGKWLSVEFDKKIQFYSVEDWTVAKYFGSDGFSSSVFSQDANKIALIYDEYIEVYDSENFNLIRYIPYDQRDGYGGPNIYFSQDGKRVLLDLWFLKEYRLVDLETGVDLKYEGPDWTFGWMVEGDKFDNYWTDQSWEFLGGDDFQTIPKEFPEFEFVETTEQDMFDLLFNGKKVSTIYGLEHNEILATKGDLALIHSSILGPGQAFTQIIDLSDGKRLIKWNKGYQGTINESKNWWGFTMVPYDGQGTYIEEYTAVVFDTNAKKVLFEKEGVDGPLWLFENHNKIGYKTDECVYIQDLTENGKPSESCLVSGVNDDRLGYGILSPNEETLFVTSSNGRNFIVDTLLGLVLSDADFSESELSKYHWNYRDDFRFSVDGTKIGTYSELDGYTRIWAVIPED